MAKKGKESPYFKDRVGEKYTTNEGYEAVIIRYAGASDCDIRLNDANKTVLKNKEFNNIKRGCVSNPNHRTIFGIGYIGEGKHKQYCGKKPNSAYTTWNNMLQICYSPIRKQTLPTYEYSITCDEWHCFQNFAKWFEENYIEGWQLDKDILVKGNKIYSPETCCFVPRQINSLFTKSDKARGKYPIGVYKRGNKFRASVQAGVRIDLGTYSTPQEAFLVYKLAKEKYIREVADGWQGLISEGVFEAMYEYKVEIDD